MCNKTIRHYCLVRGTDAKKNYTKGDMTMWLGAFVGTFQENVSLSEMRGGMSMFQKVCLKMKIQTVVGPHCVNR